MPSFCRSAPTFVFLVCLAASTHSLSSHAAQPASHAAPAADALLDREQAGKLLPATVFYHGQVAPVQARNSAGLRLPGGKLMLVTLVDTSGYASSVQQTYQGYLLSESPLRFGSKTLPAGAYGFGFIAGDQMVVMDLGGTELMRTPTTRDLQMPRPNPLQMLPDPAAAMRYRLYLGRNFVTLEAAPRQEQ